MSNKIQMTEEQARELYRKTIIPDQDPDRERSFIYNCKSEGYIIKSSLQQKVEEAESEFKKYEYEDALDLLHKIQHDVIQLLKQSHPEFKGGER